MRHSFITVVGLLILIAPGARLSCAAAGQSSQSQALGKGMDAELLKMWGGEPGVPLPPPPKPVVEEPPAPRVYQAIERTPSAEAKLLGKQMDRVLLPGYKYVAPPLPAGVAASVVAAFRPKNQRSAEKGSKGSARGEGKGNAKPGEKPSADAIFDLDPVIRALKREQSLIDLKSMGELITEGTREVAAHPRLAGWRMKLGSYFLLAGDYEGAALEMKHAINLKPQDYRPHLLMGRILDDVGDHDAAAFEYRRAIELASNNADTHTAYADSLIFQGQVSAGINEYRRAIAIKPNADSLTGLAEALMMAHDKIGSLKAARQAVSLDSTSARAHVALTKALLLDGNQIAAMRTAREAALLGPSLADSHLALGRVLHAKGETDAAVEEFQQAVNLDPLNAQARNDLGYALYSKGDPLAALTEFRIALRLNPRLGEARNNLEIAIHALAGPR